MSDKYYTVLLAKNIEKNTENMKIPENRARDPESKNMHSLLETHKV